LSQRHFVIPRVKPGNRISLLQELVVIQSELQKSLLPSRGNGENCRLRLILQLIFLSLIPTLQEPGCEALFETSCEDNPHKLIFFEIFSSPEAHKFHLEQGHTKRVFSALEGKLAEPLIMTKLNAL
jgi:quinol monooxygenase YgiN